MRIIPAGPFSFTAQNASTLVYAGADAQSLSISVLDHDLVRVRLLPDGAYRLAHTWAIADASGDVPREGRHRDDLTPFPLPAFSTTVQGDAVIIQTEALRIRVQPGDLRLTWADAAGQVFAEDTDFRAYATNPTGREIYHYQKHNPAHHYYGFGEKAGALDKSGLRLEMRNSDALGYNAVSDDPLYKHWAFYITLVPELNLAYGMFYDTLATCALSMGRERHAYYGQYRSFQADDGDLDYYLIYGPTIADVVAKFTRLIGRMMLPPRWSLGYLASTMTYTEAPDAQVQLMRFIAQCQEHDIPCDLFQLSSGYATDVENGKRYTFHWNPRKIPDIPGIVGAFHAAGIKLSANVKPYFAESHPLRAEIQALDGFIKNPDDDSPAPQILWVGDDVPREIGGHLDFTNPQAYAWWQTQAQAALLEYGI
ncbi:MAG: glycoside hydrolase family 31 protein, partial [Armatimonadetes bacterium]|nr:glycoside hydrolase family 31 protein [Anaerolineae bacterium]